MRIPWRRFALALFALALVGGGFFGDRLLALTDEVRQRLRLYTELVSAARDGYGTDVTNRDLVFASIQGMLRPLDPHTSFLSPTAYSNMRERQQGSFYGLGILVGVRNNQLTVISPIEGTPASRLGIRAGDVISTINGEPTEPLSLDEAVQKLKGPKDTQVRITIVRRGLAEPLEFTVTRAEIPQTTVRYAYMIAPGTGYLSISDFSRSTGGEVVRALASLRERGMRRLLLDLRNNGGGLLDQAIEVADQFLPAGAKIVETRGRTRDAFQTWSAGSDHPELGVPLVVLVNTGTASAAEILSGAIQDHDVGLVVGTTTWGKGLVQTVYNLSYGAGIALTTAKYYTPSGRLIQRDYSSYWDYYARAEEGAEAGAEPEHLPRPTAPADEFSTDLGRKVYGGGGITPDLVVEPTELPDYGQFLLAHNAFFNFAVELQAKRPVTSRDWRPDPGLLDEFQRCLVAQDVDSAEDVAKGFAEEKVRAFALHQVRADVLSSAFGLEAAHAALAENDMQIQTALRQFDKAADLLARRDAVARPGEPAKSAALKR